VDVLRVDPATAAPPANHQDMQLERYRVGDRVRVGPPASSPSEIPSFEVRMCQIYGFDQLSLAYAAEDRRTTLLAAQGIHRTAIRVSDLLLAEASTPDNIWHWACHRLAVELQWHATQVTGRDEHLARIRNGIPPAAPAPSPLLFVEHHDLIEQEFGRGTDMAEVARLLADSAPMSHEDAAHLVATVAAARVSRRHGQP
jgi:hypothetical protein